ncbi:expressed unknown protein [Seminavis robusta]|uniref:Uncharacterized protein n=1 Tax=Seminavis robusta TaxID=568900 RepID=A0A9N8DL17_9STRA|nr:expressed unknown protein [Seminavis robusta]|eukprot:Sro213_g088611.1  (1062) ;mRNA; r:86416-89601
MNTSNRNESNDSGGHDVTNQDEDALITGDGSVAEGNSGFPSGSPEEINEQLLLPKVRLEQKPQGCFAFFETENQMEQSKALVSAALPTVYGHPTTEPTTESQLEKEFYSAVLDCLSQGSELKAAQSGSEEATARTDKEKLSDVKKFSSSAASSTRFRHHDKHNRQLPTQTGTSQQQENVMDIVEDRASVAAAELSDQEMNPTQDDEHNLLQMATEINEAAKLEKFSNNRSADGGHTLMQIAAEINEAAKLEKVGDSRRPTERNGSVPERLLHGAPQVISQLPLPGAYMGTPGEALQRTNTLRFSLLGAPAENSEDIEELQIDHGQTNSLPPVLPNNIENSNDATHDLQLAVANLVVEDSEFLRLQMRSPAIPVDLQTVEERQQSKKRQSQWYILFLAMMIVVAAIVIGTVVGTRKGKDPVTTIRSQTATPTTFGSLEPSGVPSSAPTGILDILWENLPNYTLASLQTFGTPQWRAWNWLLDHQNITQLPEWRKTQLFALATFYYSFEGENWFEPIRERWMDDFVDECLWFSSGFSYFKNGVYSEYESPYATLPCNHLGEYTSLWVEDLYLSDLTPVVPPEISLLKSLSQIGLGWNKISTSIDVLLSSEIYKMSDLESLYLQANELSGRIASELGLMTGLEILWLVDNGLSGQIPSELGLLTALAVLVLHSNHCTGQIPSELGSSSELTRLILSENQLSGQLPTELVLLTSLAQLSVHSNALTGQLVPELALLSTLNELLLHANLLTGEVSTEFGMMADLTVFSASTNLLTGQVASEFGLLPLSEFWLDFNELTGEIPAEIWSLTSLVWLYLASNSITGSLPSKIGLLTSLLDLDLSTNRFTGTIPNEVGSMTSLQKLYLYNNSLTGTLPLQLNDSMGLRLEGNQFSGAVPEHLCSALWCDCSASATPVSTCANLNELATFPGRFPGTRDEADGQRIVLNIESDGRPWHIEWVWQQESNVTGVWEPLEKSVGGIQAELFLYSFVLDVVPNESYKLVISDSYGDGFITSGWITLTAANQTVLYSFTEVFTPFTEIIMVLFVGADGLVEEITSAVECDPVNSFC